MSAKWCYFVQSYQNRVVCQKIGVCTKKSVSQCPPPTPSVVTGLIFIKEILETLLQKFLKCATEVKENFVIKSYPPADKCILKVISDHPINVNIYLNLASSSWNHCFEYKLAVEVFSFDFCLGNRSNSEHFYWGLSNSWWVQNFIFLNRKDIFPYSSINS